MSDIEQLLSKRHRLSAQERENLRQVLDDPKQAQRFSDCISSILNSEKTEDPHLLEDIYVFGHQVFDIVRGPLRLQITDVSQPVIAFVYGFTREPLGRVFEQSARAEIERHLSVPRRLEHGLPQIDKVRRDRMSRSRRVSPAKKKIAPDTVLLSDAAVQH
jgi:hypothetical protein